MTFAFDDADRLVGLVEVPAATLDDEEFDLYVETLAKECDRFEYALTGQGCRMKQVVLEWHRFTQLTEARDTFADTPCIYVQTDRDAKPVRVGKASKGLQARYRGGTGVCAGRGNASIGKQGVRCPRTLQPV